MITGKVKFYNVHPSLNYPKGVSEGLVDIVVANKNFQSKLLSQGETSPGRCGPCRCLAYTGTDAIGRRQCGTHFRYTLPAFLSRLHTLSPTDRA
jgi:hypothetical protein